MLVAAWVVADAAAGRMSLTPACGLVASAASAAPWAWLGLLSAFASLDSPSAVGCATGAASLAGAALFVAGAASAGLSVGCVVSTVRLAARLRGAAVADAVFVAVRGVAAAC